MAPDIDEGREASDPRTSPSRLGQLARGSAGLALLVARNPSATRAMLARLARRDDPALLEAVCEHPAAPEAVVHGLAARFPEAFARGARGRAFLADPALRPPRANHLRARLGWPGAPLAWFERAAAHGLPGVRVAAAKLCPAPPAELVARLGRDPHPCVRETLALRADLPPAWVGELACDGSPRVRAAVVSRQGLPVEVMIALARDPSIEVRLSAARQPAMPGDQLVAMAREEPELLFWGLVGNPGLPPEGLELLLGVSAVATSFGASAVARHPQASERVTAALLSHPDPGYRHDLVLWARVLSPETWERLLIDPNSRVRHSLGFRRDVPVWVLARLAVDPDRMLRSAAARHERTPAELVERLARDPDDLVRAYVAENPRASEALMEALAADARRGVREAVAKWARSPSLLASLGRDPEAEVRLAVFFNQRTPEDVQQALGQDQKVRWLRQRGW